MRILMLNGRSDHGGGPKNTYRLLRALDTRRFRIVVACPREEPYFALLEAIPGMTVVALPLRRLRWRNLWSLARIVREERITCVHSHGKAAGIWSRLLRCLFPRLIVVHHYRGIQYRHYPRWLRAAYLSFERLLSRCTTCVVHVSESEARQARRLRLCAPAKQRVIHNGVEVPGEVPLDRLQARARLQLPMQVPLCMVVARYTFPKNLTRSLEIVALLQNASAPVHFAIVGDEDDVSREQLEADVKAHGLEDVVHLLGARTDVLECLCAADVYLSTSRWEGLPTSILEAMSVGLPVVASRVTGNDAVVTRDTGFLVDEDDVGGFAQAIEKLLADAELCSRLGKAARARVVAEFSVGQMVQAHETLYAELARPHGVAVRRGRQP